MLTLLGAGCTIDNDFSKAEELPDYGDADTGDEPGWDACYDTTIIVAAESPEVTTAVCVARAGTAFHHQDVANPRFYVYANHFSELPSNGVDAYGAPIPIPVNVAFISDADGDGGYFYPDEALFSGDCPVSGSTGDWHARVNDPDYPEADQGDLGGLNSCSGDCSYEPAVTIPDYARAVGPSPGACDAYTDVHICIEFEHTDASPKGPIESECTSGSGSFQLLPVHFADKDRDGNYTTILRAVQTSGTGTLTNAAWITYAKGTQTQGQALRAIRVNRPYRIGPDDLLRIPTLVSIGVPSAGMSYTPGVLSGAAPFILQEAPGATPTSFTADLVWTCRTLAPPEVLPAEPGYGFTLPSLGCPVNWPQKFVVRPEPILAPRELVFSIYGSVTDHSPFPYR